jgi:uncharacterized membrane protein YdbT with pleckstrin-like domain
MIPRLLRTLVAALLVIVGLTLIPQGSSAASYGRLIALVTGVALFLYTFTRGIYLMCNFRHEVGPSHLTSAQGLSSLSKDCVAVPLRDILGVRTVQSTMERMLGVGSIVIWTASADRPEIVMQGIARPVRVAALISERVARVQRDSEKNRELSNTGTARNDQPAAANRSNWRSL